MRFVLAALLSIAMTTAPMFTEALAEGEPPSIQNNLEKEENGIRLIVQDSSDNVWGVRSDLPVVSNSGSASKSENSEEGAGPTGGVVRETAASRKTLPREDRNTAGGNGYVYGYCTWYVKSQKPEIPNDYGNARNWPVNSQTPQVGAIGVTYEGNPKFGHVFITERVDGYIITIKEMNYVGFNKVSQRTVDYRTLPLKGFLII